MSEKSEETVENTNTYVFPHPWRVVVKSFWTKYPNKNMSFVKFNHVIDMEIMDSNTIKLKRLMFSKITFFYMYSTEDIIINLKDKTLNMITSMIKKSKVFPLGKENCSYSAQMVEGLENTIYKKRMLSSNTITKWLENFQQTFLKGCNAVEENCRKFQKEEERLVFKSV